jgi:hypothetical protein
MSVQGLVARIEGWGFRARLDRARVIADAL